VRCCGVLAAAVVLSLSCVAGALDPALVCVLILLSAVVATEDW